jgi:hypothetical protein
MREKAEAKKKAKEAQGADSAENKPKQKDVS